MVETILIVCLVALIFLVMLEHWNGRAERARKDKERDGRIAELAEEIKALGADLSKRDVESIRRDCDQMEYIKRLYLMLIGESADADTQERESEEKKNGK